MKTINTIQELRAERARLRIQKDFLEEEIRGNVNDIKTWFQPLEAVRRGAGKMLINEHNGIITDSIGQIVNLIGRRVIFRNSGIVTRLLIPYLMKNVTANIVSDNKDKILTWVFSFFSKNKNKNGHAADQHYYDKGTAHTDY
jgi:hypothetical protein